MARRAAAAEDRAEVFGFLMADPGSVARRAAADRVVAAKAARVKGVVGKFCPAVDGPFWDRVAGVRARPAGPAR